MQIPVTELQPGQRAWLNGQLWRVTAVTRSMLGLYYIRWGSGEVVVLARDDVVEVEP